MTLREEGGATVATIKTDVKLSGRVASMGQGVIGEVSKKLVDTFSDNLQAMMAPALVGAVASPRQAPVVSPAAPATAVAPAPALAGAAAGPGATAIPPAATPAPAAAVAPRPTEEASLPLMSIAGSVLIGRLRTPRWRCPWGSWWSPSAYSSSGWCATEMDDVLHQVQAWIVDGKKVALATVIATEKSSPRRPWRCPGRQ